MHVEMVRFLQIAIGPASEPEYQLLLAHDLDYLRNPEYERLRTQAFDQMVELWETKCCPRKSLRRSLNWS